MHIFISKAKNCPQGDPENSPDQQNSNLNYMITYINILLVICNAKRSPSYLPEYEAYKIVETHFFSINMR